MGTNFYGTRLDTGELAHIGKRSAAGEYCWDCRTTLCKGGNSQIHSGHSDWYEKCPGCGKSYGDEKGKGAGFVELGFAKPYGEDERRGVRTCSSFSWGIEKGSLEVIKDIKDEYGHEYSVSRFLSEVLENCPVQYFESIGREFS